MQAERMVILIPMEMKAKIMEMAKGNERSMGYHVRAAIREYLDRQDAP